MGLLWNIFKKIWVFSESQVRFSPLRENSTNRHQAFPDSRAGDHIGFVRQRRNPGNQSRNLFLMILTSPSINLFLFVNYRKSNRNQREKKWNVEVFDLYIGGFYGIWCFYWIVVQLVCKRRTFSGAEVINWIVSKACQISFFLFFWFYFLSLNLLKAFLKIRRLLGPCSWSLHF